MFKKIKIICLIIILLISLFTPIVNAENEVNTQNSTDNTNQVMPINETQEEITIKKGDEYLFQDNVTINNPVDGNIFIIANTVTINSQIGGDAFICANSINIEENGYILSNLFACADNINIKGIVYNIYSLGNTLTIDGAISRDIRSICKTLNINGMIKRDVFVNCSNINFKEKSDENASITSYGNIQGNLTYFSDTEINIPESSVSGATYYTKLQPHTLHITDYIYSLGAFLVSCIVIWLIGLWLSPKLLHSNTTTSMTWKKVLQIIGLGIIVPIVITLLSIIILLIPIASQLTVLLLCILAILFFISTSVAIININYMICNKLKITQNVHTLGFLIVTSIVFWLLTLIPYVGIIVSLISIIWGIGSISYSILIKERSCEKNLDSSKNITNYEEKTKKVESKNKEEHQSDET